MYVMHLSVLIGKTDTNKIITFYFISNQMAEL